jgi:uncharacterized protein (DUF362 family)
MRRRDFVSTALAAGAAAAQTPGKPDERFSATATQDTTPRVGVVLSSFRGAEEHDGTRLPGLADPRPADAVLTAAQIDAMTRMAVTLGGMRVGGLRAIFDAEDWVVVKLAIPSFPGAPPAAPGTAAPPFAPGGVTDPRLVRSLLRLLAEQKLGARFTLVEGAAGWLPKERSKAAVDGWNSGWGGAFDGLSYEKLVAELRASFPDLEFDLADLNFADTLDTPVPGKPAAARNPSGRYHLPTVIQQCDKLISVSPLRTSAESGVALSMANYLGMAPGSKYGFPKTRLLALGSPDELIVDWFALKPADFAVAGGCLGLEGDGQTRRHNLVLAGASALAVDACAAAAMGFDPSQIAHLTLGERKGFGIFETELVWTRGNSLDEARQPFQKPAGWRR